MTTPLDHETDATPRPRSLLTVIAAKLGRARAPRAAARDGGGSRGNAAIAAQSLSAIFSTQPASLAQLVEYTQAGDWAPGDQAWPLEAAGRAYGYLVAIPVTVALYVVAWLVQRPSRLLVTVAVSLMLWLSW